MSIQRTRFLNPSINWRNPITALLKHAWFVAPITGAESASGKQYMKDIVGKGNAWNLVDDGTVPAGIITPNGFGLRHGGTAGTRIKSTAPAERYGNAYTGPITIAIWVKTPSTIIDFGTMLSKYSSTTFHYGFAMYLSQNTGRANTFFLSYNSGSYHEAHAGENVLTGGETALLAWSGKFGTSSSHVLYKNGRAYTPTWFTGTGTGALTDDTSDPNGYMSFDDVWAQPLGSGGTIYSIMLWDRMLSAAEHASLYAQQTRFGFICTGERPGIPGFSPTAKYYSVGGGF